MRSFLQKLHRQLGPSILRMFAVFSLLHLPAFLVMMLALPEYAVVMLCGFMLAVVLGGIFLEAAKEEYQ